MKIGVDARGIIKKMDGISRYGINLFKAIGSLDKENEYIIYKNPDFENKKIFNFPNFKEKVINIKRFTIKEQFFLPSLLKKDALDIFHSIHNILPVSYSGKMLVTIHDIMAMSFLWFYRAFSPLKRKIGLFYFKTFVKFSLKKACKVVAVSEFTKKELLKYSFINPSKIVVSGEAPENRFRPIENKETIQETLKKHRIDFPYILYFGNFKPYKNVPRLIQAYQVLKEKKLMIPKIVLAGEDPKYFKGVFEEVKTKGLSQDFIFLRHISDDVLPSLISASLFCIFPSIYEGFGLPALESISCGTPVIASKIPPFVEVLKNSALFVDPYNPESIARGIRALYQNETLRKELSEKGLKRAKEFSWVKVAKGVLSAYNTIL